MDLRRPLYRFGVYPLTDLAFSRNTFAATREITALESQAGDTIRAQQLQAARELLTYAARHVPYYRDVLGRAGLRPETIGSLDAFQQVPVLTKTLAREHHSALVSDEFTGTLKEFPTSGSTGTPLVVLEDQTTNAWRRGLKWRYLQWWNVQVGDRGAVVWLEPLQGWRGKLTKRLGFALNNCGTFLNVANLTDEPMRRFWSALARRRVTYVYGYTSALTTLARFALQAGLDPRPLSLKVVIPTTETLFPTQRELMERAFGARVANEYGCAELGDIAFECPAGRLHVAAHTYLVEVAPPYLPVDEGVCGQILVTHLRRRSMPFIRYALGDVIHLVDERCACGRPLPVIRSVEGRVSDIIQTPDGRVIHSEVFDYIMREFGTLENPAVTSFRAIQNTRTDFELLIVPGPAFAPGVVDRVSALFTSTFGAACRVQVRIVDAIPPDPSGKRRFFLSKVARPAAPAADHAASVC